ncbi:hypothetical protein Sps_03396 [Shewanella psychrophila]|uniref:Uncharacterized protein n=1 Tax=Shewanella psychrophila TaxID=225848 RepID=A0A1S6HSM1_9GAMM|nr:hypothetical protein [Shewanella psychrophila]AQS38526.1 hypothetical protein Sps_03396 [Shewanella psychrophila]
MFNRFFNLFKREKTNESAKKITSPYAAVKVWFDDLNVWVHWPEKEPESIAWSSLVGVLLETTDEGPFVEDVWWHLATDEKFITYPSEATGVNELLTRLQTLPEFNNKELIDAMGCSINQKFILWDHQGRHK